MLFRRVIIGIVFLSLVAGILAFPKFQGWLNRTRYEQEVSDIALPPPQHFQESSGASMPSSSFSIASSSQQALPDHINWDVPFTPQAPLAVWDALHEEACEEASILMVLRYFRGEAITSPQDAETAIQSLVSRSTELGFTVDLTAKQARTLILDQDPSLFVDLLADPSVDQLKEVLLRGALIIVPAAGQQLGNPYFQRPGPKYHMLVIRGFTADGHVITNDPGTKRGEQFVYTWEALLSATHDWNNGDVENGQQVMLVVEKR